MKRCLSCGTMMPPRYDKCPSCGSENLSKFQTAKHKFQTVDEIPEPITAVVTNSVSNLWMNVSGL